MTDHDEIERVLAALDGRCGPAAFETRVKDAARIIRELRAELARWKDPESPERQALQEEVILALGDGARSEIALRESQLDAAEAALGSLRADHEALRADFERYAKCNQACRSYVKCGCGMAQARERWRKA